jgi:hypothetical protein
MVIATRAGFPRMAAVRVVIEAVRKLKLPIEFARRDEEAQAA